MSNPYIGEIRMFGGNFAPLGWALCNGQILSISQNETLFTLIGTTYGGDGVTTFALPNLQSRVPIHAGQGAGLANYVLGQNGGVETVTLTQQQTPSHSHIPLGTSTAGSVSDPAGHVWAGSVQARQYVAYNPPLTAMNAAALSSTGGQPHENMLPFLTINFIIALEGIFPPQS